MPDGYKRPRRNRGDKRSKWYAHYRSYRFNCRFGTIPTTRPQDSFR